MSFGLASTWDHHRLVNTPRGATTSTPQQPFSKTSAHAKAGQQPLVQDPGVVPLNLSQTSKYDTDGRRLLSARDLMCARSIMHANKTIEPLAQRMRDHLSPAPEQWNMIYLGHSTEWETRTPALSVDERPATSSPRFAPPVPGMHGRPEREHMFAHQRGQLLSDRPNNRKRAFPGMNDSSQIKEVWRA